MAQDLFWGLICGASDFKACRYKSDSTYEPVYGQEAILPVEVNPTSLRLCKRNNLPVVNNKLMMDNIDEVVDKTFRSVIRPKRIYNFWMIYATLISLLHIYNMVYIIFYNILLE